MSRAMAESLSQQDFYGTDKMHYMASQAICNVCTTAILTFKITCVILLHFLKERWETLCTYIKRYVSQMLGNLWKLSSRKLMVTSTMTIGSSYHVLKYQKARRLYHQYGQCNASKT